MTKFRLEEKRKGDRFTDLLKQVVVNLNGDGEYVDEVRKLLEANDKWVLI